MAVKFSIISLTTGEYVPTVTQSDLIPFVLLTNGKYARVVKFVDAAGNIYDITV